MAKAIIYHNILWAHYKAVVFSELYKQCQSKGLSLEVIHYAVSDRAQSELSTADHDLHRYPFRTLASGNFSSMTWREKFILPLIALWRSKAEIVVLPGYSDISYWLLLLGAKLLRMRVLVTFDSTERDHIRTWWAELTKRIFITRCDGAFAYGTRSRDYLVKLGMPRHSVIVGCQASDNETLRQLYDDARPFRSALIQELDLAQHNFCFVGRLSKEKNVGALFEALKIVQSRSDEGATDWGLLIVGEGTERKHLEEIASRLRLRNVSFVGGASWREVPRLLTASDVLVLPSSSEPWGLVVNEAMACGLPVVVSNACGCSADLVMDNQTGFLFDAQNFEQLAEVLGQFVKDPLLGERLGRGAQAHIQAFSPSTAATQMLSGFAKLLT